MMRVVLAGGAGLFGSHLAERLVSEGYGVVVVDDLWSGLESNLSSIMDRIEFIKSDIGDFDNSQSFDIMINLASMASRVEWETYPVEVALSNSLGNNNLINMQLRTGPSMFMRPVRKYMVTLKLFPRLKHTLAGSAQQGPDRRTTRAKDLVRPLSSHMRGSTNSIT